MDTRKSLLFVVLCVSATEGNLRYKMTQLEQEVKFLRHVSVQLQQKFEDQQLCKNYTDDLQAGSFSKTENATTEISHEVFDSLSRKLDVLNKRLDIISTGVSHEKHAVRETLKTMDTSLKDSFLLIKEYVNEFALTSLRARVDLLETSKTTMTLMLSENRNDIQNTSANIKMIKNDVLKAINDKMKKIIEDFWISIIKHTGWKRYKLFMYKLSSSKLTFKEAVATCSELGAWLVDVQNAEEMQFLFERFGKQGFWIGATDQQHEGIWTHVSGGSLQYTNWLPGEPNDVGDEDCAITGGGKGSKWNDERCSLEMYFICKKDYYWY